MNKSFSMIGPPGHPLLCGYTFQGYEQTIWPSPIRVFHASKIFGAVEVVDKGKTAKETFPMLCVHTEDKNYIRMPLGLT